MSESQESLSSQTGLSSQEGSYQTVKSDDGNYEFIVTERLRPFRPKDVNEHVAVYRGHYNGEDVIVKVSALSGDLDTSIRAETEIAALEKLEAAGCQHAPRCLGHFKKNVRTLVPPEGVPFDAPEKKGCNIEHFVLISYVPAEALCDVVDDRSDEYQKYRTRIQRAFDEAIQAVHACGVDNGSYHFGNVLWSKKDRKCFIIDFEMAEFRDATEMPAAWSQWSTWDDGTKMLSQASNKSSSNIPSESPSESSNEDPKKRRHNLASNFKSPSPEKSDEMSEDEETTPRAPQAEFGTMPEVRNGAESPLQKAFKG